MTNWRDEIEATLSDFITVSELAGDSIRRDEIVVEFLDAPHRAPSRLPIGKMAIYGFWRDGAWLKIGKAGPKSQARYTSQHYGINAMSTLAKSLIRAHMARPFAGFDPESGRLDSSIDSSGQHLDRCRTRERDVVVARSVFARASETSL